jgi:hypothetical protein
VSATLSSAEMGGLLDTLGAPDHVARILRRQDPPLEGQSAVDLARATLSAQDLFQLLLQAQVCHARSPFAFRKSCSTRPRAVAGYSYAIFLAHRISPGFHDMRSKKE